MGPFYAKLAFNNEVPVFYLRFALALFFEKLELIAQLRNGEAAKQLKAIVFGFRWRL